MKKIIKLFVFITVVTLILCSISAVAFATDFSSEHFIVQLKREYCYQVYDIISQIECDDIAYARELTNPEDYEEAYNAHVLVFIKDTDKDSFENARLFFSEKPYVDRIIYDPILIEPLFLAGDVDMDGDITANDARTVLRFSVGLEVSENKDILNLADIDADGYISANDARQILRISVGLDV